MGELTQNQLNQNLGDGTFIVLKAFPRVGNVHRTLQAVFRTTGLKGGYDLDIQENVRAGRRIMLKLVKRLMQSRQCVLVRNRKRSILGR